MSEECSYSFWDLFEAANKRKASRKEVEKFNHLVQEKRNKVVKKWARLANWGTDDRVGTDGQMYTAFCPLWKTTNEHSKHHKHKAPSFEKT